MRNIRMVRCICTYCGVGFDKYVGEVNRWLRQGKSNFFCSSSHAGIYINSKKKSKPILLICGTCGEEFQSSTNKKAAKKFCSRSCASAGSVTDYRRSRAGKTGEANLRHDLETIAAGLRVRESWKYVDISSYLKSRGIEHQFEFPVANGIFDLAIPSLKLFIEFDGRYHLDSKQAIVDKSKEATATLMGWRVVRVAESPGEIIPPGCIAHLF
jgi:very-short-patch-repair endonuclease